MKLPSEDKVFDQVKADYNTAINAAESSRARIKRYRNIYRNEPVVVGKKVSTFKSYAIKKAMRKVIPSISESILSNDNLFAISSVDSKNRHSDILNYQWNHTIGKSSIVDLYINNFFIDGTGILKAEWSIDYIDREVECRVPIMSSNKDDVIEFASTLDEARATKIIDQFNKNNEAPVGMKTEKKTVREVTSNSPRIVSVDPMKVLVSKNATMASGSEYIIEEMEVSYADILGNKDLYKNGGKAFVDEIIASDGDIRDSEYNYWADEEADISGPDARNFYSLVDRNKNIFTKKVIMKEYWGTYIDKDGSKIPFVMSWMNDTVVRYAENPFSHGMPPYAFAQCNPSNDSMFGESDSEVLSQDQSSLNKVSAILDKATENFADNQEFIEEGFLPNITQEHNYKAGKTVFFKRGMDPRTSIYKNTIEKIPDTAEYLSSKYENSIKEELFHQPTGPGQNGEIQDSFVDGEMSKLRRALAGLSKIGTFVATMNRDYLMFGQEFAEIRTSNGSVVANGLTVTEDMIAGEFQNVSANANTKRHNDLIANNMLKMINSSPVQMSEPMITMQFAEVARLWGRNGLADKMIEESNKQKEPDPMQQLEMKRLELELKKVEAETAKENARAEEYIAKAVEKYFNVEQNVAGSIVQKNMATKQMSDAHKEKFDAQTLLFNQEFNLIDSGAKEKRRDLELEYAHAANLEREKERTDRELALNYKSHKQALEQKSKDNNSSGSSEKVNPLLDYIRSGTLENDSYDTSDDVYRNIREKNSLDTTVYTGKEKNQKDG